ncbi:MAG: hypothetical protein HKO92_04285 [Flavobacteriaceae bacterium]|nr:hypothetical protein [Flavobacteriaceae bacterium]
MKNKIYKIALVLSVFLFALACDEDTFSDDSTAVVTSPTLTVSLDFGNSVTLVETEATYGFTVTLSDAQVTDVRVNLTQIDGDATEGEDFSFPHSVTIPAGSTSASDVISIHEDDLIEETETAVIKITTGNEANVASINGETVTFNIQNLVDGDLAVGLDWAAASLVTDNAGNEIDPHDLADLRLVISTTPDNTGDVGVADGSGSESFVLSSMEADGDYYIVADFYDAQSDIPSDLNLTVQFDQVGVINHQTHEFASGLNTTDLCADLYVVLAKVTKTGGSYAFEEIGEKSAVDFSPYVGTWSGEGTWNIYFGYTSDIVTTLDTNGDLLVNGVSFQWFEGWWGEVIVTNEPVRITSFDPCTGNFEISEQFYCTTTWNGNPQPEYGMSATGTLTNGGGVISMQIFPTFHQGGGTFSGPEFGGVPFEENVTLD